MKHTKYIVIAAMGMLLVGCLDNEPPPIHILPPEPVVVAPAPVAPTQNGTLQLAKKSGCLACHGVKKKIVGPSWTDVAIRYRNKTDAKALLIAKVKKGGGGNWGNTTGNAAMPPYSPRVSDENIEILVDFILNL